MDRRSFLRAAGSGCAPFLLRGRAAVAPPRPNIIVILADDIGYGDFGSYGATVPKTPNLDRLAQQGIRFTDAHSSSATCTPTRYALITGEYAWRKKGTAILPGDANLIVEPGRPTLPSVLKEAGYTTGCVGKWHLGLGSTKIDWNAEIAPGPNEIGFNYHFIIPATGDRVPCVYVEDKHVVNLDPKDPILVNYRDKIGDLPTGKERPDLLKMKLSNGHDNTIINGISRIGYMSGGRSAWWKDEDIAKTITGKATAFIERNRSRPFFLYFATHDVHVPRVPGPDFAGSSACGVRCDAVQQFDWTVGRIMATLDRLKLANDTLLVVTSDNGPVVDDGYADGSVENLKDHKPSGPLRGGKYSLYEGGTRLPFLARWPARIKPGVSGALIGQVDLMASLAALAGSSLPANVGPDSMNVLPALLGESQQGREYLVEHARNIALRQGQWKLIPATQGPAGPAGRRTDDDRAARPDAELYDLANDLGERTNVAAEHPGRVRDMTAVLEKIRTSGRSRGVTL